MNQLLLTFFYFNLKNEFINIYKVKYAIKELQQYPFNVNKIKDTKYLFLEKV